MRYLRMLSNSAFAGLLAAVYLTLLLLHLNPAVPLERGAVLPLLTVMTATYGVHIFVVSYGLYVLRQIALGEPASPGWISLRLLTWSAAALSGTAAVMTWLHAAGLANALPPPTIDTITLAAVVFAASAAVFLVLGIAQAATRHGRRATVAILFTLATIGSIVGPLVARGPAAPPPAARAPGAAGEGVRASGPRIVLLCLEGASLDVISPAVASGRLPNFGRILDRGASMHLATTRPTQPEPAWASVVTGKWPAAHGVRGAALYRPYNGNAMLEILPDYLFSQALVRFGFLVEDPHTSRSLLSPPLWEILGTQGLRSGVIGLPLTHPAAAATGFIVSDRFHRRAGRVAALDPQPAVSPPALQEAARATLVDDDEPAAFRGRVETVSPPLDGADMLAADRLHHRLASRLGAAEDVRLLAVRYAGLDAIGHYYLRYAQPAAFGDVTDEERRIYGRVLDDYYGYVDALVGEVAGTLREGDILVIVSAFGMEPLTFGKRMLERVLGDERFSGTHERAPDGFIMAYGTAVAPGRLPRGTLVDVVPTLLYFLGLPVARDMAGFARTEVFTPAFNEPRTLTFIPTYGGQ
jgi:hypothetical protein